MFGFKRREKVDKDQLELIKNAQSRIRQKKKLYYHFIVLILGCSCLFVANKFIGLGKQFTFLEKDWYVFAIILWIALFTYHVINVFILNPFLGKSWEENQLQKLMALQQKRIEKIKTNLIENETLMAKNDIEKDIIKKRNLTLIVAADNNDAIGKDNTLIWHLSNDLKRFKALTSGHHIIMGRKTFESFPKPLPNRTHIVITRQNNYQVPDGVITAKSMDEALTYVNNDDQPFIIGGGEIYKLAMPYAYKIELTRVNHSFNDADTFFVPIDEKIWKEISKSSHSKDDLHDYDYAFISYVRT